MLRVSKPSIAVKPHDDPKKKEGSAYLWRRGGPLPANIKQQKSQSQLKDTASSPPERGKQTRSDSEAEHNAAGTSAFHSQNINGVDNNDPGPTQNGRAAAEGTADGAAAEGTADGVVTVGPPQHSGRSQPGTPLERKKLKSGRAVAKTRVVTVAPRPTSSEFGAQVDLLGVGSMASVAGWQATPGTTPLQGATRLNNTTNANNSLSASNGGTGPVGIAGVISDVGAEAVVAGTSMPPPAKSTSSHQAAPTTGAAHLSRTAADSEDTNSMHQVIDSDGRTSPSLMAHTPLSAEDVLQGSAMQLENANGHSPLPTIHHPISSRHARTSPEPISPINSHNVAVVQGGRVTEPNQFVRIEVVGEQPPGFSDSEAVSGFGTNAAHGHHTGHRGHAHTQSHSMELSVSQLEMRHSIPGPQLPTPSHLGYDHQHQERGVDDMVLPDAADADVDGSTSAPRHLSRQVAPDMRVSTADTAHTAHTGTVTSDALTATDQDEFNSIMAPTPPTGRSNGSPRFDGNGSCGANDASASGYATPMTDRSIFAQAGGDASPNLLTTRSMYTGRSEPEGTGTGRHLGDSPTPSVGAIDGPGVAAIEAGDVQDTGAGSAENNLNIGAPVQQQQQPEQQPPPPQQQQQQQQQQHRPSSSADSIRRSSHSSAQEVSIGFGLELEGVDESHAAADDNRNGTQENEAPPAAANLNAGGGEPRAVLTDTSGVADNMYSFGVGTAGVAPVGPRVASMEAGLANFGNFNTGNLAEYFKQMDDTSGSPKHMQGEGLGLDAVTVPPNSRFDDTLHPSASASTSAQRHSDPQILHTGTRAYASGAGSNLPSEYADSVVESTDYNDNADDDRMYWDQGLDAHDAYSPGGSRGRYIVPQTHFFGAMVMADPTSHFNPTLMQKAQEHGGSPVQKLVHPEEEVSVLPMSGMANVMPGGAGSPSKRRYRPGWEGAPRPLEDKVDGVIARYDEAMNKSAPVRQTLDAMFARGDDDDGLGEYVEESEGEEGGDGRRNPHRRRPYDGEPLEHHRILRTPTIDRVTTISITVSPRPKGTPRAEVDAGRSSAATAGGDSQGGGGDALQGHLHSRKESSAQGSPQKRRNMHSNRLGGHRDASLTHGNGPSSSHDRHGEQVHGHKRPMPYEPTGYDDSIFDDVGDHDDDARAGGMSWMYIDDMPTHKGEFSHLQQGDRKGELHRISPNKSGHPPQPGHPHWGHGGHGQYAPGLQSPPSATSPPSLSPDGHGGYLPNSTRRVSTRDNVETMTNAMLQHYRTRGAHDPTHDSGRPHYSGDLPSSGRNATSPTERPAVVMQSMGLSPPDLTITNNANSDPMVYLTSTQQQQQPQRKSSLSGMVKGDWMSRTAQRIAKVGHAYGGSAMAPEPTQARTVVSVLPTPPQNQPESAVASPAIVSSSVTRDQEPPAEIVTPLKAELAAAAPGGSPSHAGSTSPSANPSGLNNGAVNVASMGARGPAITRIASHAVADNHGGGAAKSATPHAQASSRDVPGTNRSSATAELVYEDTSRTGQSGATSAAPPTNRTADNSGDLKTGVTVVPTTQAISAVVRVHHQDHASKSPTGNINKGLATATATATAESVATGSAAKAPSTATVGPPTSPNQAAPTTPLATTTPATPPLSPPMAIIDNAQGISGDELVDEAVRIMHQRGTPIGSPESALDKPTSGFGATIAPSGNGNVALAAALSQVASKPLPVVGPVNAASASQVPQATGHGQTRGHLHLGATRGNAAAAARNHGVAGPSADSNSRLGLGSDATQLMAALDELGESRRPAGTIPRVAPGHTSPRATQPQGRLASLFTSSKTEAVDVLQATIANGSGGTKTGAADMAPGRHSYQPRAQTSLGFAHAGSFAPRPRPTGSAYAITRSHAERHATTDRRFGSGGKLDPEEEVTLRAALSVSLAQTAPAPRRSSSRPLGKVAPRSALEAHGILNRIEVARHKVEKDLVASLNKSQSQAFAAADRRLKDLEHKARLKGVARSVLPQKANPLQSQTVPAPVIAHARVPAVPPVRNGQESPSPRTAPAASAALSASKMQMSMQRPLRGRIAYASPGRLKPGERLRPWSAELLADHGHP